MHLLDKKKLKPRKIRLLTKVHTVCLGSYLKEKLKGIYLNISMLSAYSPDEAVRTEQT